MKQTNAAIYRFLVVILAATVFQFISTPVSAGFYVSRTTATDTTLRNQARRQSIVSDSEKLAKRKLPPPSKTMSAALLSASLVAAGCLVVAAITGLQVFLIPWLLISVAVMIRVGGFYTPPNVHRAAGWAFDVAFSITGGLLLLTVAAAIVAVCVIGVPLNAFINLFRKKGKRRSVWGDRLK